MKFRTDKAILRFLGMDLGLIFLGVTIYLYFQSELIGAGLIFGGLIMLIIGIYVSTKTVVYLRDERSAKNMDKAGYHAFWIILYVTTIIILLRMLKLSPSLTPSSELSEGARHLWEIGLFTFIILRWYYNKKGEA